MADFTEFLTNPRKAVRNLHVTQDDVRRGVVQDWLQRNADTQEQLRANRRAWDELPPHLLLELENLKHGPADAATRLDDVRAMSDAGRAQEKSAYLGTLTGQQRAEMDKSVREGMASPLSYATLAATLPAQFMVPAFFGASLPARMGSAAALNVAGNSPSYLASSTPGEDATRDAALGSLFGLGGKGALAAMGTYFGVAPWSVDEVGANPLRKSLSNPAWLKAEIAGKHMLSAPQQQERLDALMRRVLDMERTSSGVDPEQAFALRRSVQRLPTQDSAPSSPLEQLNFEEFAGGGSVKKAFRAALPALFGDWSPSVVKPKGGNWLAGSVEDALRGLKRGDPNMDALNATSLRKSALNSWIEGPLTKYVKTRMASPDDEVRKLAEQGVLHYEPQVIRERSPLMEKIIGRRETAGFPIQGLADAPFARNWENASDTVVRNLEALDLSAAERAATFGGKAVPKETIVHEMNPFPSGAAIYELGLPHLIDELSNALNPNSGLPAHLQLTPEAVKNMSMEKAVRRVADINAWRAAQKVEANRKLAEQAALVREYAENNPKGLRWVELKAPEVPEDELGITDRALLQDQLKYEGDTMGHCVGGYCDDVLSGKSRIFSLRDAKGEPHVTVETGPTGYVFSDIVNAVGSEKANEMLDRGLTLKGMAKEIGFVPNNDKIVQIKGKQNRKPNDEYLPFVQDFVKNPPHGQSWAEVGDLQNTGLRRTIDAFNSNELKKIQEAGIEVPTHVTSEELEAINRQIWPDPDVRAGAHPDGFASGGPIEKTSPWSVFSGHNSADWPEEL